MHKILVGLEQLCEETKIYQKLDISTIQEKPLEFCRATEQKCLKESILQYTRGRMEEGWEGCSFRNSCQLLHERSSPPGSSGGEEQLLLLMLRLAAPGLLD